MKRLKCKGAGSCWGARERGEGGEVKEAEGGRRAEGFSWTV